MNSVSTSASEGEGSWFLAAVRGMGRRLSQAIGVISATTIMILQLVALGTEQSWRFRIYGWPDPDLAINLQRNFAEISPQDWPAIGVIVATGVFAGLGAAFAASAVRHTASTISNHFNTTWHVMTSPPTDVVRADKDTREWVNTLTSKESAEQKRTIAELVQQCEALKKERRELIQKVADQEDLLRKAGDRLKANERVFSQFEKLSRAMQSRIDRARQKYPV